MTTLKTKDITITNEKSRDNGKKFRITEMPLLQADEWATTLGLSMAQGGISVSGVDVNAINFKTNGGILEIAKLGLAALGNVDKSTAKELIRELTESCVRIITTSGTVREVEWDSDIAEVATLWTLRKEALAIHIDFLDNGEQ